MAVISYDYGHGTGNDRGASGIIIEEKAIREYGPVCVNELMRQGHTLVNCTPNGNMTLKQSLAYRVDKANLNGSQLHICFHANAFNKEAHGAEVEVASDAGEKYGQSILSEICKLGFTSRGVKRPSLYVTGHTKAVCVLIEPFFCDSPIDVKLYNPNALGVAIAKGVIKVIGGKVAVKPVNSNATQSVLLVQQVANRLGVRDLSGNKIVEDGILGKKTLEAKAKIKIYIDNVLK